MNDAVDSGKPGVVLRDSRLDTANDLARVRELFALNGFPRSEAEVAWIYQAFAGDAPFASLAEAGADVAALYATVPARFKCGDRIVRAAQSLDTMVDARYRGLGLFTKMARKVYSDMADDGVGFVYGFPNGNSFHGFVAKLEWQALDPVPFLFRPLDAGFALGKLAPALGRLRLPLPVLGSGAESDEVDGLPDASSVDALWAAFATGLTVARVRDHAFLDKRYVRHPRARYRYRIRTDAGRLTGLAIYCVEDKHGGRIGYLMELLCEPGASATARHLVAGVLHDMRVAGCHGALAWSFAHSPLHGSHLRNGFMPLPQRLRPIELHFGFRALRPDLPELADRRNWYLSYSDSDTV
jgi:hypothetical protein